MMYLCVILKCKLLHHFFIYGLPHCPSFQILFFCLSQFGLGDERQLCFIFFFCSLLYFITDISPVFLLTA